MQKAGKNQQQRGTRVSGLQSAPLAGKELSRKATSGVIWSFLAQGLNKGFTLVTIAILSRILLKSDFGLLAIATMTLNYLAIFKDLGLGSALIQHQSNIDRASDTVFTLNCLLGIALTLLTFLVSPLIASYFGEEEITIILQCLGITFFINSLGSVHLVLLRKKMDFRKKLIPDVGNALVKGVVSICMALAGFGIWSLVIGQIAGSITALCLVWRVMPWWPRLSLDTSVAGPLIRFGLSIMGTETLSVISSNLYLIVVGKVFGMSLLGVFSLAYRLPEVLIIGNLWLIAGVLFPMFSLLQSQPEKLVEGFLSSIRFVVSFTTPICFGLFIVAEPLIRVLYGDQWLEAIPVLQILAAYAWVQSIGYHAGDVYKAIGRPNVVFVLCLIAIPIDISCLLVGAQYGLVGVASGLLIAMLIQCCLNLIVATYLVRVSSMRILAAVGPSFLSGVVLLFATWPLLLLAESQAPILQLGGAVLVGATGYLGTLWITDRKNLLAVYNMIVIARTNKAES